MKLIGYVAVFDEFEKLLVDTYLQLDQLLPEGYFNLTFGRLRQKYRQKKPAGAAGVYLGGSVSQLLLRLSEESNDCARQLTSKLQEMPENRCVYLGVGFPPKLVNHCRTDPLTIYCPEGKTIGPVIFKIGHLSRKHRRKLIKAYENLEGSVGLRSV